MSQRFPDLGDWLQTRDTLHAYSRLLGAVRRLLMPPHPRWWHISLELASQGLTTGQIPAPTEARGGDLELTLNLRRSRLALGADGDSRHELSLLAAPTATELGQEVVAWLRRLGIESGPERSLWVDDGERSYDPEAATRFLRALLEVEKVFERVRSTLSGETGPIQLWPHHLDLSFEWFGSRRVEYEEEGEARETSAQIGFGFSTGDDSHPEAYFYATPWPFEEPFLEGSLPAAARWQTVGWQGGLLPYTLVRRDGPEALSGFLRAVYEIAAPHLN